MLIDAYLTASHHSFTTTPINLFPSTVTDLFSLEALEDGVPKLQHALTVQYEDVVAARFSKSQPLSKRACTASHSTSGSKSVHTTYLDLSSRLPPAAAITTAKIRTGTLDLPNRICRCGDVTLTTSHCLSCKKLRGRFVRHDLLVELLKCMLKEAGFIARSEVMVVEGTSKRMSHCRRRCCGSTPPSPTPRPHRI